MIANEPEMIPNKMPMQARRMVTAIETQRSPCSVLMKFIGSAL
jgi:hypothetical protein